MNRGSLVSEATALPTEPQPLPRPVLVTLVYNFWSHQFLSRRERGHFIGDLLAIFDSNLGSASTWYLGGGPVTVTLDNIFWEKPLIYFHYLLFMEAFGLGIFIRSYIHHLFVLNCNLFMKLALESMLKCMHIHALDKFKPVFIYCRFNISWIRKTVSVHINIFCLFLKWTSLA